jgi:hypothetical protein
MRVRLRGTPVDIVVIVVYMPTSDYEDDDVEEIYEQIEEEIRKGRGDDYVIVMGDFNAAVGEQGEDGVAGRHGLGQRNDRGQMLLEFCKQNKLCITNTWYKHNKRRKYTWKSPGDMRRMQLDYILVKQRYRNSVKNSHAYPGADADSDHNLVAMKVNLKLKRLAKPSRHPKWKLVALKGAAKEKLNDGVRTRLQNTQPTEVITEQWNVLKRAMIESAEGSIGRESRRAVKKPWVNETMLRKMDTRRRWKRVNTVEGKRMYRKLNNELRRETDAARERYWEERCEEIEALESSGKVDEMYRKVKDMTWKNNGQRTKTIMSKQGTLLSDSDEINRRWKEYIEELYNKAERPEEIEMEEETEVEREQLGPSILEREILYGIHDLKVGKAEGEDGIPAEMLKALEGAGQEHLIKLCKSIYDTGIWPEDFLHSTIVPIQKKPNALKCEDHRTISLISHASKILLRVVNNRLRAKVKDYIGWDQFGFRKGMGTREAIAVLRTLSERNIEHNQDIYVCFVDYEKAFDRVNWTKLMRILKDLGVDWKDRRLIKDLYMGQTATVRTGQGTAGPCIIGRGVRQGCLLSPLLFNIYAETMMKEAMEGMSEGVKMGGHLIQAVRYADDQAMTANSTEGLQNIMTKLNNVVESYGMRINKNKTKVMKIGKGANERVQIKINDQLLEQVHQFNYLGSMLTEDGRSGKEVKKRIAMARDAFNKHQKLLTGKTNQNLKKRLIKTLVWSVLLYSSETWTLKRDDIKKLESCEMWFWRRMERISWRDHVRNEEVLRRVGENRNMIVTIWKKKARWIGHTIRSEGMLRTVMEGRAEGKRGRGRRRLTLMDDIKDTKKYHVIKQIALDRGTWRQAVHSGPALGQTT